MKKSLIITLALVFVLGIAGTAFAANPFVDVPANHWAYGAVSKLAKAGLVDGMGDGTFQGNKEMTRYEMAQIVAKAMAKSDKADAANKALIEKLEAEFAAELNNLGVRVSNLEKKVGSIKLTGDARVRWIDAHAANGDTKFQERVRLFMKSDINETTTFTGKVVVMDNQELGTNDKNSFRFVQAYFTTKDVLGTTLNVGRMPQAFLTSGYWADADNVDGLKVTAGNKLKVTAGLANWKVDAATIEDAVFVAADYPMSKVTTAKAMYLKEKTGADSDYNVWGAGFATSFDNFKLNADYTKNTAAANDPISYVARLTYKNANKAAKGSFDVWGEYRKFELNNNDTGLSGASIPVKDIKAWAVGADYTLAKNIVLNGFYSFNGKVASTDADAPDYTRLQVVYSF